VISSRSGRGSALSEWIRDGLLPSSDIYEPLPQPTAVRVSNLLSAPLFGPIPVGGKSKD